MAEKKAEKKPAVKKTAEKKPVENKAENKTAEKKAEKKAVEDKPTENKAVEDKPAEKKKEERKRKRPGPASRRVASKRHAENKKKVDSKKRYQLNEAVNILRSTKKVKFDETVEIAMNLGIDPRKSDQLVRGSVSLPKGTGKTVKILVFAEGDQVKQAQDAGAEYVGGNEYVEKIEKENWFDFDLVIAAPSMMRHVGKLGKVLGPKGKMPSPKSGTVTTDVATAVREFKAGKVEYRSDSGGNVLAPIGKLSFVTDDIVTNANTFIEHIRSARPSTTKGIYIKSVSIASTMGPGLIIDLN